jgi:alpha-ribazole phosphatase
MSLPMTQLYLVRHGQTDWNVEGRYQGQTDVPLNAAGRAQAELLSAQLAGVPFTAIYSSPLVRATETAKILARPSGLPVQCDARLREINLGLWEGQLSTEIAAHYPAAWAERRSDPLHARVPGGETVPEVAARLAEIANAIAQAHPAGPVLIVSHGLALSTLLCQAQRRSLAEAFKFVPQNSQTERVLWPPAPD